MSTTNVPDPLDPEDMFADSRMSIGDHIEDLRTHLLRALKGFMIGMVLGIWPLGSFVLGIITAPVEQQLLEFEKRKVKTESKKNHDRNKELGINAPTMRVQIELEIDELREALNRPKGAPAPNRKGPEDVLDRTIAGFDHIIRTIDHLLLPDAELAQQENFVKFRAKIPNPDLLSEEMQLLALQTRKPALSTMNITEGFMVYIKVAFLTGLVLSSPWVFYHVWMFIAAGLYPNEKRLVNVYLPFSLFLFISGVLICQFAVMPRAVGAMLWFNEWLGLDADLRLNEWLGFALMMPIVFGLSFQTPLVMMFVHRIGVVSVQMFRDKRRIAWFAMAIFAAMVTPSVDALSMLFLWVPMGALYELGILLCIYQGEQTSLFDWEEDEKQSGDMVEV